MKCLASEWLVLNRPPVAGFHSPGDKPAMVGDLKWFECWHDSNYGRIVSNWKREGQKLTMEVTIPANTTATVFVTAKSADAVTESGQPASKATGVKFLHFKNGVAVFGVGGGSYQFQSVVP